MSSRSIPSRRSAGDRTFSRGAAPDRRERRPPCHGRPAVLLGRPAARHPAAGRRPRLRPRARNLSSVEAGIQWPALLAYLDEAQDDGTGMGNPAEADRRRPPLARRRALRQRPRPRPGVQADRRRRGVASRSWTATGESTSAAARRTPTCSALAIGGYGLFGVIYSVTLRLAPRSALERVVEIREIDDLIDAFDDRIANGFLYGDFQFAIDPDDPAFLRRGVFSCYRPVADGTPIPAGQRALTTDEWRQLLYLAHVDKAQAWRLVLGPLPRDLRAGVPLRRPPVRRLRRRLPPLARRADRRASPGDRDDHRDLCAA